MRTVVFSVLANASAASAGISVTSPSPGATVDCAVVGPGGNIDGSGTGGRSCFLQNGTGGVTLTFDASRTNGLPTEVGIVWTDRGGGAPIPFEALDANGDSLLGKNGPNSHADNTNNGTTAEDRFYGAGISKVKISNSSGGITASDSLLILKKSVGQKPTMNCPACLLGCPPSG